MLLILLMPALAGCYLASGQRVLSATPNVQGAGQEAVQFVTSDGQMEGEILLPVPGVPVRVEVTATVRSGELVITLLDASANVALSVAGRYGLEGQGGAVIQSDAQGRLHFRVTANEAREGAYAIRYQLLVLPTPTPTSTPTPAPTP